MHISPWEDDFPAQCVLSLEGGPLDREGGCPGQGWSEAPPSLWPSHPACLLPQDRPPWEARPPTQAAASTLSHGVKQKYSLNS